VTTVEPWPVGVVALVVVLGVVLLAALLIVLVPVSTGGLGPRPKPARDYADAMARFEAIAAAEAPVCNPAIHSLLLSHGQPTRRVYVFIHGTTNSPRQFEELGRLLHARGHTVYIPLMPRHGRRSMRLAELRGLRAEELRDYADAAVDLASGLGQEIVAVGISGGAAVVGWMGQNRAEMHTALLLAPFLGVRRVSPAVGTAMMNVYSRMPSVNLEDPLEPRRDWVYRGQTTRALAETLRIGRALFRQATVAPPAGKPPHPVDHRPRDAGSQRRDLPAGGAMAGAGGQRHRRRVRPGVGDSPQRHRPGGRPGEEGDCLCAAVGTAGGNALDKRVAHFDPFVVLTSVQIL
jgi:hypothetical protein